MEKYQIASVLEKRGDDDSVVVNIKVSGSFKIFQKNIKEIHTKEWLKKFSPEDVAYIGFLAAADYNENRHLINSFQVKEKAVTCNTIYLGMFFVCFLIMSNLTASKVVTINFPFFDRGVDFPAALIFFPVTYLFSNVLTEVYGFKVARTVIWCGFTCGFLVVLIGTWAVVNLPNSQNVSDEAKQVQVSYEFLFSTYTRIYIASSIAYFFGEFINSMLLAKLKILSEGKYLYVRVVSSSIVAVSIDSVIFCSIAFYSTLPFTSVLSMALTLIVIKVAYEIAALPLTYWIVAFLKKKDKIDHFDIGTNFNPFAFRSDD